jgi:integrase
MGLGPYPTVGLAEARQRAGECRRLLAEGIDPIEHRRASQVPVALSFRECAERYIAAHEAGWRNAKHRQQWRNTLSTYAYPVIGEMPVAGVDVGAVMRILEPMWREKPETASRVRGRIESVLDFASARGWRPEGASNPARWRGHLQKLLPPKTRVRRVEHHAALDWRQVPAFMAELRKRDDASSVALQFTILTASRTGEAIGARWEEIDLVLGVWTVPRKRMKAGRGHRVPLSPAALNIARRLSEVRTSNFVFPGLRPRRPLSNMAMTALLRRMGRGNLTVHGFRSAFRDWAAEATAHPREVAEAALAHVLRDTTEAAYQRGDLFEKRRKLMDDWAAFTFS